MRLGIMQPYLLPYIGYFQLVHAVDMLILYDNIKYTKKGWINRNRFLRDGKDVIFSIPLRSDSDSLHIRDRHIAADFDPDKLINQLRGAYVRAPYVGQTLQLLEDMVHREESNLFDFLNYSIRKTCQHLGIATEIRSSSDIEIDHSLKGQEKVLAICSALDATTYINLPGGVGLYENRAFQERNIELRFIQPQLCEYSQQGNEFVPWLSILDVLMFNSVNHIRSRILPSYILTGPGPGPGA